MLFRSANAGDAEIWVQSLGQEDPLKEEMAAHSSILGIVNKAEIDVFLELSCFFDTPTPCELVLLGILAWVGCWGAQIAATNWLPARGRLFKSAGSTGARSLFGNFCRGKKS